MLSKNWDNKWCFQQKGGLSEENLLRFVSYYSEINLEWLLTGKGEMLRCNANDGISIDRSFVGHDMIGKVMGNINNNADTSQSDLLQEVIRLRKQLEEKERLIASQEKLSASQEKNYCHA